MELDAQYERIVRLIPVDELESSCNSVIQEGLSSVDAAVSDVASSFAKLREVRDAANRLQNDAHEHNSSLLAALSGTLKLQLELDDKLDQVLQVSMEQKTRRKRRRPHEDRQGLAQTTSGSSSDSSDDSESEAELSSASEDEGNGLYAGETSDKLEKVSGLRRKELSGDECIGGSSGGLFTNRRASATQLDQSGATRVLNLSAPPQSARPSAEVTSDAGKTSKQYLKMAIEADEMPVVERLTRIRGVLLELSEMLELRGTDGLREEHAVNILRLVVKWRRDPTHQRGLVDAYNRFLKGMAVYERGAQNTKSKARLKGLTDKLSRVNQGLDKSSSDEEDVNDSDGTSEPIPRRLDGPDEDPADKSPSVSQADADRESVPHPCNVLLPTSHRQSGKPPSYYRRLVDMVKREPLVHRPSSMPSLLVALIRAMEDDDYSGQQKRQIVESIGQVVEWITEGLSFKIHLSTYRRCADALISYARQHQQTKPLQRVAANFYSAICHSSSRYLSSIDQRPPGLAGTSELPSVIKSPSGSVASTCRGSDADQVTHSHQPHFSRLVAELATSPNVARSQRIVDVVVAFKTSISGDSEGRYLLEVTEAVGKVLGWIHRDPRGVELFRLYGSLFKTLSAYSTRLQSEKKTAQLDRLLIGMSEALLKPPSPSAILVEDSKTLGLTEEREQPTELMTKTDDVPHLVTSDSDTSSTSGSESESDFEDEKEAMGGSQAAWNAIMAAANNA